MISDDSFHKPTQRVIAILEELATTKDGIPLTQLATRIGSSKGTIFPVLSTLQAYGFVVKDTPTGRYRLGRSIYMFSESFRNQDTLMSFTHTCMQEVVDSCSEICQLGVLSGREVLYIAKVDSKEPIQIISHVGSRIPAHKTALGKSLLCEYDKRDLEDLLGPELVGSEDRGLDLDALCRELEGVRAGNIAQDLGGINEHLYCLALPIRYAKQVDCAISVSLPSFRSTPEKQAAIEEALRKARDKLEYFMHDNQLRFGG